MPYSPAEHYLAELDTDWAKLIADIGPHPERTHSNQEPYEALIRAVAHQQLHGKAAENILNRLVAYYPNSTFPSPDQIFATTIEQLRSFGFSNSKAVTILGIAEKTLEGTVPTRIIAETLTNEELIKRLVTLRGIGQWTVEIFLMHTLHRPDILPVDDFGIREGWKVLKALEEQPKPRQLAEFGKVLSPYRTTASWYLWRAADRAKQKK
ncbi:MAG: DNA-3-methyladenine glycosylase 2 family protein [Gammaproteobacteria bacterium]|nr:DNA-3-methyladenine glycosylase 2 family protein [Gammaproteobacteria bacterium]